MAKDLPIDPRIVLLMSKATVKNLIDGIVELVTNSDDSYKRLEKKGYNKPGIIEIYVKRQKGGICTQLVVKDYAEGMSREELEEAIVFAGETKLGASIRGLFGRGLKETIMALGEGEIISVKDGECSKTKLWLDQSLSKPQYDDEMLSTKTKTDEHSGTTINIIIKNEKIRITTYENFKGQLTMHFALRDINSSQNRKINLIYEDLNKKLKNKLELKFERPQGKEVFNETKNIPGYGDKVKITIYESSETLDSPKNNPCGLAGILIKTNGCILDNRLFKFENDLAGFYFYGDAICPGLEKRLRKGEKDILDPNRSGLDFRHEYSKALAQLIERELEPFIIERKKLIEQTPKKEIKTSTKSMLKKLCKQLNEFAQQELDELPDWPVGIVNYDINQLMIKPENANIPINVPRVFTIYAPTEIITREGVEAFIESNNVNIQPLSNKVKLEQHKNNRQSLLHRSFKVIGKSEGAEGIITVNLGAEKAFAKVKVAPFQKKKRGEIAGSKKGFISDIIPDELIDPTQRVVYEDGIIKVFTKFPSISKFIESNFDNIDAPEGKLLLSELVGEAFCKELAMKGIESGKYLTIPDSEIDSFNATMNEIQKKYLHKIQDVIFTWKF